jgi:hypothetical protein
MNCTVLAKRHLLWSNSIKTLHGLAEANAGPAAAAAAAANKAAGTVRAVLHTDA